ncbi:DUF4139 domain-containing protein [Rhizorhapis suberifaciens]|uniref:DUF4139 domain-containing protein n=1 Tax=Rhizorhapis suberifaciens TaxID=13656 RepID=A0A840HRQ5_9SPHN|nr:hypothetical protein [Rhizorhapis suberifaciens]MBB4640625.1 hypothetical protein [Rhizorhapis suberifaciens]
MPVRNDGKVWALGLVLLLTGAPAFSQTTITSPAPGSTSVTIYRDPDRGDGGIDLSWLNGFALITEHRRIAVPQGESLIRFEGVANGMIAVSAVVTGLPGGVIQKNRDAKLLTPASLLDGALGNRVHIRRTNIATGKIIEAEAVIRSGADNAVVLQTAEGVEGLRCSGLPETLVHGTMPEGLSAKPTLSVTTRSEQATTADVTLTYLATGFDWSANYVARVNAEGRTLDLLGWLTVANSNDISFADSQLLAVAGRVNRKSSFAELVAPEPSPVLNLRCWPMDTTSTADIQMYEQMMAGSPAPPPAPMMARMEAAAADVVVTAQSRKAVQEDLGDLKLYRVPMRVDVNANGQKQMAMLEKRGVPFTHVYGATLWPENVTDAAPLQMLIRMRNREKDGLGAPLPSGGLALFESVNGQEMLVGEDKLRDHAVGEEVEVKVGASPQLQFRLECVQCGKGAKSSYRLTITNANNRPAAVELRLQQSDGFTYSRTSTKLARKEGDLLWKAMVPANGSARLDYTLMRRQ